MHKEADKLLLMRMQEDSSEAFDALYEKYWELVYSAAFKRLNDPGYAKDITQDIFLQLWSRRKELVIDNLPAYLFTAVRNNVYKWMERDGKYTPIPDLLLQLEISKDDADAKILHKEFLKAYEALVGTLTSSQQVIFQMRYQQDLSTEEIAERLNISRKTVQNQLGRSIALLRESFTLICLLSLALS
ncbi:RNA polymerase sigma factor [Arcticibacter tournemirensis]|uniref:Sigma-70 family RNA polymerase sigma factor n=1 Tax=Arcticibacter tournemirensis TaxID=699437 RepID=A0A4Q0M6U0_9SPHI|nr:sigma-70 family RNA polymerase sigma factor [Arcticibacter tournemirensis]RXF68788.1 sigma-70 family RNA polymerase sigma factor [Arcticibacter tournemirensis]